MESANDTFILDTADHDASSSLYSGAYTLSYSKLSCVRGFYFAHIVFNYLIFLSGLAAMITRILPIRKGVHQWLGRIYIISMLWSTACSLLIHNTGLPIPTIYSFAVTLIFLSIGWFIIVIYIQSMNKKATDLVHAQMMEQAKSSGQVMLPNNAKSLQEAIDKAKVEIVTTETDWKKRFFSLKYLHGILFIVSWIQLVGRIFASNQSGDFTCYTYPAYKPIDTPEGSYASNTTIDLVPANDPNYEYLPWASGLGPWMAMVFVTPLVIFTLGALAISIFYSRKAMRSREAKKADTEENAASEPIESDGAASEST